MAVPPPLPHAIHVPSTCRTVGEEREGRGQTEPAEEEEEAWLKKTMVDIGSHCNMVYI